MSEEPTSSRNILKSINDRLKGIENTLSLLTLVFLVLSVAAYFIQAYIYEQQLQTMKHQEKQQLRAYVGSVSAYITGFHPPGTIVIRNALKNFGATPAYEFTFSHSQIFAAKPADNIFKIDAGKESAPAKVTLFPSEEQNWSDYANPSPEELTAFNNGTFVALYYGALSYKDAFDDERRQTFCYFFTKEDADLYLKNKTLTAGQKCNNTDISR